MGSEGGTMAGHSWMELAWIANSDPARFRFTIRDPAGVRPGAKMPAHSNYNDATLDALTAYFRTFAGRSRTMPAGTGRPR
jgi:cytochrome c1